MRLKNENGFTLIEVITVVFVMGIMAAISAPVFLSWKPDMRLKAATRDLYSNMQKARIEAVKRNANVVIVLSAVNCPALPLVPSPGGTYLVFIDNGAGMGGIANDSIQNGTELTISSVAMPRDVALCSETFGGSTGFTPQGLLIGSNIGSLTMSNTKNKSNIISLTIAGGVRIQ